MAVGRVWLRLDPKEEDGCQVGQCGQREGGEENKWRGRLAGLGRALLGRAVRVQEGVRRADAGNRPREMGQCREARPRRNTGQRLGQQAGIEGREEKSFVFSFSNFHPNFECKFKSF